MDDKIQDIVAVLTESGVKTRRERAAFVAKLRDEMGLSFKEIGAQVNVSAQRAQQLYTLNKYFQRSASSPFANMSTRARHFLERVASYHKVGDDWEHSPAGIARLLHALTNMTETEAFKFKQLGRKTYQEVVDFMKENGVKFPYRFEEALEDETGGKDLTPAFDVDGAMQQVARFLNEKGFRGEFKVWAPGTYKGPYAENAEFVVSFGGFLADAWEESWSVRDEFDALVKNLGWHYEMATRSVLTFFKEGYFDSDAFTDLLTNRAPQQPLPPVNLKDVNLD